MSLRSSWVMLACLAVPLLLLAAPPSTRPVEGLRQNTPATYALINASVVTRPGRRLDEATIVIRDGLIAQVGADVDTPAGARVVDLTGKTVYPGLFDAFNEVSVALPDGGAGHWNSLITPQRSVALLWSASTGNHDELRKQGVTTQLLAPSGGIIKGTSAVVLTGDSSPEQMILRANVAQHIRLTVPRGRGRDAYPNSPMGAVALARQTMYDAEWYRLAWSAHRADPDVPRPEHNDALASLQGYPETGPPVVIDALNELYFLRADRFAREFGLPMIARGSGNEYRRLEAIQQTGRAVLVPVDFPQPPNVGTIESALRVELEDLLHWDLAPENPGRLAAADVPFALTSYGLEDRGKFLSQVRVAVQRGLSEDAALGALTQTPARLFGVEERVGTIARGKIANLVVTDGDLFHKKTKVLETWVAGKRFQFDETPVVNVAGTWSLRLEGPHAPQPTLTLRLQDKSAKVSGEFLLGDPAARDPAARDPADRDDDDRDDDEDDDDEEDDDEGVDLTHAGVKDARFSCTFSSAKWARPGTARLTAVITGGEQATWTGHISWPDGSQTPIRATRRAESEETSSKESEEDDEDGSDEVEAASFAVNYPLGAFGRSDPPPAETVLFRNATIWTCGPEGVLVNASLLIRDGRIALVGSDIEAPEGARIVDARGKHLTPGIIDCHSHMGTDGGVNESTQSITAEVRIGDFIDADDIQIYRQLAGGVTSSNILHGSANAIGGQNQVIKLRWGALPEAMKFAAAPQGIKFALGENVKQSNWGDEYTTRYPQTRMGVEQIIRDAFLAARKYQSDWAKWERDPRGLPPRRDLELEALMEIQNGERWIHCHSYRQDEILALIRTLDEFGITIGTFQHILEGYKVADAMQKHGAMGSAFSDWWAYKFEVYDAIPYAGALMHNAGVVVSFNSDDRELARHLNHEAAKAEKYGGVPAEEALKFVTLNPARQLRIDQYVGSLEAGKHADLVVWSGDPLSILSRCEQTWVDGRKYFGIDADRAARQQVRTQRVTLVQKILNSSEKMKDEDDEPAADEELWPRWDIFCRCQRSESINDR